jgi:ParB-like chromosome segregation protein Spo0J
MPVLKILCQAAATLPLEAIEDFQGDLKKISRKELDKLKTRIKAGFKFPFYIWDNKGAYKIIAGHQRRKALIELQAEGWEIPPLPVVWIQAKTEKEALQAVLEEISQYGDIQSEELAGWLDNVDEQIKESLRFLEKEIEIDIGEVETEVSEIEYQEKIQLIIEFTDMIEAEEFYNDLAAKGIKCKLSTV